MRIQKLAIALAAAAAVLGAVPAAADPLPRPERIGAPPAMLRELNDMLSEREPNSAARIARLDAMLAGIGEPGPLRGFVQFLRALHLQTLNREPEAREAIEESIRLLPEYSAPLLLASQIEAFADRPGQAADYLLRASEIDPHIVRQIPPYELRNIFTRLSEQDDPRRHGRLAERMIAINWAGSDINLQSQLALSAIRARVANGNVGGARSLVPRLVSPQHLRSLLIDNRYRALWSDLERWGGARQERQWPLFLAELRARFEASGDLEAAQSYAWALRAAGHNETIVRVIGPLFAGPLDRERDDELLWVATLVADALARLGRWAEVDALFVRAAATWPLGSHANALNVAGNRARYRLYAGDARGAAAAFETVIADAERWTGQVSQGAMATIHLHRACALQAAGRGHDAVASVATVLGAGDPTLAASLHLCFDRPAAARAALIEGLQRETTRDDVLAFVQPSAGTPMQSDYGHRSHARAQALQRDPALLAAVARYGRVLPHPTSAGAPPESVSVKL